jgi:DNA-binding SARP family transcriptional activator
VEFRILGPLEVCAGGREVDLPAPKVRALLAVLVVHRGEVVSADALVEALWGEEPPEGAVATLRGYVSHLRGQQAHGKPWSGGKVSPFMP